MKDLARQKPDEGRMRRAEIADKLFDLHNEVNKAIAAAATQIIVGGPISPTLELAKLTIEQALKETMIDIKQ